MQRNKLIYWGLLVFIISVTATGVLWYLGDQVTGAEFISLYRLYFWVPIVTVCSTVLGLFLVSLGLISKIKNVLLRKIFFISVFFLAIFLFNQFVIVFFLPATPLIVLMPEGTPLKDYCAEFGKLACLEGWAETLIRFLSSLAFLGFFIFLITGLFLSLIKFIKKKKAMRSFE